MAVASDEPESPALALDEGKLLDYITGQPGGQAHQRGGYTVERPLRRKGKVLDDDVPEIGKAYRTFRAEHHEPGL